MQKIFANIPEAEIESDASERQRRRLNNYAQTLSKLKFTHYSHFLLCCSFQLFIETLMYALIFMFNQKPQTCNIDKEKNVFFEIPIYNKLFCKFIGAECLECTIKT